MTGDRFDSAKDAANREQYNLPLIFGDLIFKDDDHLIMPSIREIDGEERFKVVGIVQEKRSTGIFVWRGQLPCYISVGRNNKGEERAYHVAC
jgi:uncharacterized DUF497 family protein